jgi:ribosomal protein L17
MSNTIEIINDHNYVTDYLTLMDYLINSPKDVELHRRPGIIENWLGDDEAVSTMFTKLSENVIQSKVCYAKIFKDLNEHCNRRKNVWIANLRHNYFNSPWALISCLATAFLLLLALAQTIFSILP